MFPPLTKVSGLQQQTIKMKKEKPIKYPFFQSITNHDMVSPEDREKIDDIHRKTSEEQEKRNVAGMEALEDIKKILYHLWT